MLDNTCAPASGAEVDTARLPPLVPKSAPYLRNLHQEHLARRQRLGAVAIKREPEAKPKLQWATPQVIEVPKPTPAPKLTPAPQPAACILDLMMGGGDQMPPLRAP